MKFQLKEKLLSLVETYSSEEKILEHAVAIINKQSNKYDTEALELLLDIALVLVDPPETTCNNYESSSHEEPTTQDADDEGDDDVFIFPCHITFDDCHPELLANYHQEHLRNCRTAAQLIKYPKLCEFAVDSILKQLENLFVECSFDYEENPSDCFIGGSREATGSLDRHLGSVISMIHRLNKVCCIERKNCKILARTNVIGITLGHIHFLLTKVPQEQHRYLEPLLKFALTLADYRMSADNLKQLLSIMKNENTDLKTVLTNFEELLIHHHRNLRNIQPLKSINFPTASRTAEEIESNSYLSNSWHWRLRSKVIEFKRKQSRFIDPNGEISKSLEDGKVGSGTNQGSNMDSPVANRIAPSWLECSIMTPLSNVSPIMHNGEIQFCCSMWVSVCGDVFVIDSSKKRRPRSDLSSQFVDRNWRSTPGHWLRLTSRRRISKRYNSRHSRKNWSNSRRPSIRQRKRLAHDEEDETKEEEEAKLKKSQSEFKHMSHRLRFNYSTSSHAQLASRGSIHRSQEKLKRETTNEKKQPPKEFLGRRARDNSQELLMHMVSFALDTLTIEIWLNVRSMTFCARACRVAREGQTNLIDQVTFPSHLESNGNWSHLMFCLNEVNKGSDEKVMHLRVLVDGVHKEKEKLVYSNVRNPVTNFACLIGCERSTFGYVWKLSQINVYRSIPPKNIPMYILGKGPDFWSFTNFGQQSTLTLPDITQRFIKNLMIPKVLELYSSIIEEQALNWLTQNTVIAYRTNQLDYFLDYSTNTIAKSIMHPLSADHEFNNSSERFIQARVLNFSRSLRYNTNYSLGSSLIEAGGVESVLILFADIVRRAHESATIHSLAFSVLIKMCQTNQHHLNKFLDDLNGLKLVEFILNHSKCVVSRSMLDHYFDLCFMRRGEHSLIKSPKLFYHMLNCWRAWHKDTRVAKHFYRKLIRLVRPSDSTRGLKPEDRRLESFYINHNFRMMNQAGSMDILMGILRACLVPIDHHAPKINHDLVELIVNLLSLLIKHPPSLDVISDIMEFLIFLHPDPKAYIDAASDKMSYLKVIQINPQDGSTYEAATSRLKTPLIDTPTSHQSSSENVDRTSSYSNAEFFKKSYSRGTMNTSSSNSDLKDRESLRIDKYMNQNGVDLRTVTDNYPSLDTMGAFDKQRSESLYAPNGHDLSNDNLDEEIRCSNRSYAIACISDVLASIVKLSLTDPMKILSTALEKPIIDTQRLIILANNDHQFVREKVLRLFLYCIRACYSLNISSVLEKHEKETKGSVYKLCTPIMLMARQLLKYPTSAKMIQLCYGIIVGIEDFETVEKVCLVFDIETIDNNLQLNTLMLLIRLMTRLQKPEDIISSIEFIHAYMKQLLELNKNDILCILVKGNLVESLFRLYFYYVEREIEQYSKAGQTLQLYNNDEDEIKSDYGEVRTNLDKVLILIVRYYLQNLTTTDAIQSIEDMLLYLDLMNTYVPTRFQFLLRDRKVKILTAALNYCEHYEECARQRYCGGKVEYYLKSFFTTTNMNLFPNAIPSSRLDQESIFTDNSEQDIETTSYDGDTRDRSASSMTHSDSNGFDKSSLDGVKINDDSVRSSMDSKTLNEKDVIARLKAVLDFSAEFITNRESEVIPSPVERKFIMKCIGILSSNLIEFDRATSADADKNQWSLILPKLERSLRINFTKIALYLLSPCDSMSLDERKYYALKLLEMFSIDQLMSLLYSPDYTSYMILDAFVRDLIGAESSPFNSDDEVEDEDEIEQEEFMDDDTEIKLRMLIARIGQELGMTQKSSTPDGDGGGYSYRSWMKFPKARTEPRFDLKFRDIWIADLNQAREDNYEKLESIRNDSINLEGRSFSIFSDNLKEVHNEALEITREVVNDKHKQRKAYLEDVKHSKVYNHIVRQQWLSLIIGNTHERAIWYIDSHYPKSWELNPVEGPSRVRRRLRPCKLRLDGRYLRKSKFTRSPEATELPKRRDRMSTQNDPLAYDWYNHYCPHPLCSMIVEQEQVIDSNELRIRMFTTDAIHFNCDCSIIRPNEVCEGEISIATWCIHFIGQRSDELQQQWTTIVEDLWFDEILEIWDRRYQLQDVGLEIFLTNNMTYLISFRCNRDREDFKQILMREPNKNKMINLQRFNLTSSLNRITQLWRDGRLTNFDYLTCLNKLAGRSFNDLMQYPVFPFVLSNYISDILDLNSSTNFRNFKKPMAIQNPEKESNFINNYENSKMTSVPIGSSVMTKPYHYGNHYSNSATVLHFLVRLPPFTQMLIQYQDDNFDQPDRTFHSVASTWQLITQDSNTDFKELIPEFFYLPEMFLNFEQFELGRKQNDELVDNVRLPTWCPGEDARMFVLINRQALESAHVSENLHHWIDLIFGFKQTGRAAVKAMNVFHPATYYGAIDFGSRSSSSNISDQISSTVASVSTKIQNYGSDYVSATNTNTDGEPSDSMDSRRAIRIQTEHHQVNIERLALETMIKTYGQMPRQLFAQPVRQRSYSTFVPQINNSRLEAINGHVQTRLEPLRRVRGLRWGSYVGSPDESNITAIKLKEITPKPPTRPRLKREYHDQAVIRHAQRFNLCLLPNGEIVIFKNNTSLILDYRADRKSGGGYQLSLPQARYSRRTGRSNVARMNSFSNMIISRQQFTYSEPHLSSSQLDSAHASPSLMSFNSTKPKFSHKSLSLVSWSYLDGTIRVRYPAFDSQKLSDPLVQADSIVDSVSTCASIPELNLLLVGYKSGAICAHIVSTSHKTAPVVPYTSTSSEDASAAALSSSAAPSAVHFLHVSNGLSSAGSESVPLGPGLVGGDPASGEQYNALSLAGKTLHSVRSTNKTTRWLYCHSDKITCMKINVSFGIIVSASDDGSSVVWDLNSLTYVRTISYKARKPISDPSSLDYLCTCGDLDPIQRSNNECASSESTRTSYSAGGFKLLNQQQACICKSSVSLTAISDTLGDIVTVKDVVNRLASANEVDAQDNSDSRGASATGSSNEKIRQQSASSSLSTISEAATSSILYVHTINGTLVGCANSHSQITAVTYSNAPEGISINVIVVGLADGLIRLYSSWDLSRVKEFKMSDLGSPITSLLYSHDNQLLYIAYEDGQLVLLRNKKKTSVSVPKEWFL